MKLVFLNGGLANQVFQYAFYRYAQLRHPEEDWVLDDSFFYVHEIHNGYELESVFGLKPNLLSQRFDPDVWEYMIELKRQGKSMPEILNENGMQFIMLAEYQNWKEWNPFSGSVQLIDVEGFFPEQMDIQGDIYYHGYWIIPDYLKRNNGQVLSELIFTNPLSDVAQQVMEEIESTNSIGVHIRRGDYSTLGFSLPEAYYQDAVRDMENRVGDAPVFYVLSDDIDWCKNHCADLGLERLNKVVYVEPEEDKRLAWQDMLLLSKCRNLILSNSSFCYLAALMNPRLNQFRNPSKRKLYLEGIEYNVFRCEHRNARRALWYGVPVSFPVNINTTNIKIWQEQALACMLDELGYTVDVCISTAGEAEPEPGYYYDVFVDSVPERHLEILKHLKVGCRRIACVRENYNIKKDSDVSSKYEAVWYVGKQMEQTEYLAALMHFLGELNI